MGSFVQDLKSGEWSASDVFYEITGLEKATCNHRITPWRQIVPAEEYPQIEERFRRALEHREAEWETSNHIIRPSDGAKRWMVSKVRLQLDEDGRPVRISSVITDRTAHRDAAMLLARDDEQVRLLFHEAADGMCIIDQLTRSILLSNAAFARLLGREHDSMVGLHPWEWDHELSTREAHYAKFPVPPSEHTRIETRCRRLDGTLVDVDISLIPMQWDGRPAVLQIVQELKSRNRE